MNAAGCLSTDLSGRNRSGSNLCGSGPHADSERCKANAPITAPLPAGTVTPHVAVKVILYIIRRYRH